MKYDIVETVTAQNGQTRVIVSNGADFFVMTSFADGSYTRRTADGLTLSTRGDFDFASIGAKKCKTLKTAIKWGRS